MTTQTCDIDTVTQLRHEAVELSGRLSNLVDSMSIDDPTFADVHRADQHVASAKHCLYTAEVKAS